MKNTIIYPGTFDPITFGHIDIIERAAHIFEKVIVGVIRKPVKSSFMFTLDERIEFIRRSTAEHPNIEIDSFDGLLVNYAKSRGINLILRGLRAITDFEYEFQMALTNKKLINEIETVFMMANEKYSYLSSSMVKEISRYNGDVSDFVPAFIAEKFAQKLS